MRSASMAMTIALVWILAALWGAAQVAYAQEDASDETVDADDPFHLPEALQRSEDQVLPKVLGPVHLRDDARGKIPAQPVDIQELLERFYPTWTWAKTPERIRLTPEDRDVRVYWEPEAGACYAGVAIDHAVADFEARQGASDSERPWWEAGADIDIQIRDAETEALIVEDLSRQLMPKVQWCSDGRPVRVDVRLGVPEDAADTVDVTWGIAVDQSTLAPLRFAGRDALAQRLLWAQSVVTPRGEARTAPAVFEVHGPTLMYAHVRPPEHGCDVLIAIGEAGVQDLSLAHEDETLLPHDFAAYPLAAVPVCASDDSDASTQEILVGVRRGQGRVALQRFGFSR